MNINDFKLQLWSHQAPDSCTFNLVESKTMQWSDLCLIKKEINLQLASETASLNFPLIAKSCWFCSVRRKKLPFFFHIVVRQSFILISSFVESFVANLFYSWIIVWTPSEPKLTKISDGCCSNYKLLISTLSAQKGVQACLTTTTSYYDIGKNDKQKTILINLFLDMLK